LRGITEAALPALQAALDALGLLDADAATESVRNIVASPLAGLDPTAPVEVLPLVRALDARLAADRALHALPGKFGFLVDGGGLLPLDGITADIGFVARSGAEFRVLLAGVEAARCAPGALVATAATLATAFLRFGQKRVRDVDAAALLAAAGLASVPMPAAAPRHAAPLLGFQPMGETGFLGVGAPFGRLDADTLALLADCAEQAGGDLRLTPWRALLVTGVVAAQAPTLQARLAAAGLILDDADPLRAVAACPGVAGCANATTPTQDDARSLAPAARLLAPHGIALHVSGCAKGCAHPAASPVVLVGSEGRYRVNFDATADRPSPHAPLGLDSARSLLEGLAEDRIA
jgi:precorrin-3B synthase